MIDTTGPKAAESMHELLERVRPGPGAASIDLGEITARMGPQSFAALLLVIGLLMVSPLSSVPLLSAVMAVVVVLTAGQAVLGRRIIWLPPMIMNRQINAARLHRALDTLDGPAGWLDRRRSGWLKFLAQRPFSLVGYAVIMVAAMTWPPLSLVPLSTTIIAVGMTLIAAGLTLRDGVFVLAGYVWLGLLIAGGVALWTGLV